MVPGLLQIAIFLLLIGLLARPMGAYMARVFSGEVRFLRWLERPIYRLLGVNADDDQPWTAYALSLLAFSVVGLLATYGMLRLQSWLPLNQSSGGGGHRSGPDARRPCLQHGR